MRYLAANLDPPHTALGEAIALSHIDRREAFNANTHIGLGWFLGIASDRNLIFHGGSTPGYNTFVGFDPVKRTAVVVLANSDTDITDIGFHLLEPKAPIDDDPPVVKGLYAEAMKRGFDHLSDIVATARHRDPAYVLPEAGVNSLGYRLLEQQRFAEAIEIFKLNVANYPQSADTFDSLGEAYEDIGNRTLAIQNYQRSLELNPKSKNAVEHLVKLRANPQR
jgi:tetratricopeptide (TPR) repeat protein